ncbi:Cobalt-zinc-cadmium resistance protein CzcA [BD1-7 clade bacterium]|uniref:Cobalt-zinc-cadmium resistance protein CzcA n=1 Tax=BD1-7 clade bacterium TaxID=2029982 RepID=A0A5S9PRP4_9GAMM|nr:Cobalt-zinc-cadmium resistance protein CzcA [BD1-7 clade bacterium]
MDNPLPTETTPTPKRNIARFCVENRQITFALLFAVLMWGLMSYHEMPRRKDPDIPARMTMAVTPWKGHSALEVENLVTQAVEDKIAESSYLHSPDSRSFAISSLSLAGVSYVQMQLEIDADPLEVFSDINLKLQELNQTLPQGAGPVTLNTGFGETSAIMLSLASPRVTDAEVSVRAKDIERVLKDARKQRADRVSLLVATPLSFDDRAIEPAFTALKTVFADNGLGEDMQLVKGSGFLALDFTSRLSDPGLLAAFDRIFDNQIGDRGLHPDAWRPVIIRDLANTREQLASVAGDRYSFRELNRYAELIAKNLSKVPQVSKTVRSGNLPERVYLDYSQEQLAAYGIVPSQIKQALAATNITIPGGVIDVDDSNILILPSGRFTDTEQIGDVVINAGSGAPPVFLRSLVDIRRGYESPPSLLSYFSYPDETGAWQRSRAVNLSILMKADQQIEDLGEGVDAMLETLSPYLPGDLIIRKMINQPDAVTERIDLFMRALYEAILLVMIVAFIGFSEWRSAVLLMLPIPVTLAMTFGMSHLLGIEIQQVSLAALIIALGLLVDDPVVAGDAIKRELARGKSRFKAAWVGPTRLARPILYATITNIVAYLPLLLVSGEHGLFLHSLPIVMTCALISSRIVSITFVPFLGYYLLKKPEKLELPIEEKRKHGFSGRYYRFGEVLIDHRKKVLVLSLLVLVLGGVTKLNLKKSFFPLDLQYLAYIDVWAPNDATITYTNAVTEKVETLLAEHVEIYSKRHNLESDEPLLTEISTTVGGSPPRFWFTANPEQQQPNFAQMILRFSDKEVTGKIAPYLNVVLQDSIAGASIELKELQTTPLEYPVAIRVISQADVGLDSAEDELKSIRQLRLIADKIKLALKQTPTSQGVRDDWGETSPVMHLDIDPVRANLSGITNKDVAASATTALSGTKVGTFYEGDKQIPIVAKLRAQQRARLSDLDNLYIYSLKTEDKVPLLQVANTRFDYAPLRISRLEQLRTITVSAFPSEGYLASDVMSAIDDQLQDIQMNLPAGYEIQISGAQASREFSFKELTSIMMLSIGAIYLALVFQFKHLIKPLVVFSAVPYGVVGALVALLIAGQPFGFMAFLAIVSLIGIIVSHIIVLFDFVEEQHALGAPLKEALLDAGILRLRPVLITIGATVFALVPLALEGGPLWKPLCYAQIGGLLFATFTTLLLVPVIYAVMVLDLKWIGWDKSPIETLNTQG